MSATRTLVNGNLENLDSKFTSDKQELAKIKKQIRQAKKAARKTWSKAKVMQEAKNLSFVNKQKYLFWAKINHFNEDLVNITYDAKFNYEKSKLWMDYLKEKDGLTKSSKAAFKKAFAEFRTTSKDKTSGAKQKETYKSALNKLKEEKKKHLSSVKTERKNRAISKSGYKSEIEKSKLLYKGDKNSLKTKMEKYNKWQDVLYVYFQNKKAKKKAKKVFESKTTFLANKIPTDFRSKWRSYVSPIAEFIFPGLGSLMNREYFKGFILLVTSALVYFLTIGFASGLFQIVINGEKQGGGIQGLITLGSHSTSYQPDSRFYLVFGVISLLFLLINFTYSAVFSRVAYKKSRGLWNGFRGNGKVELKRYMGGSGFAYFVATPIYVIILFTSLFPLLTSMIIVFTNYGDRGHIAPVNLVTWVGFDNLKEIFKFSSGEGKYFLKTLTWSFIWGVGSTFTAMFAGIGLALLVNHPRMKGKKTIRVLFLLPMAIPFFIMVLYFKIFFGPTGTMNHDVVPAYMPWHEMKGAEIAPGIRQEFADLPWFSKVGTVKTLLFLINIWFGFAGTFLFITGLLQGLSKDLYEAADIAGANAFNKFSRITSPIILYQIAPILIGAFIGGFNNFGLIYLFTEGGPQTSIGGPGETDILASYVFKLVKDEGRPALAATYMFTIAILFGGLGLAGFSRTKMFRKGM